MADATTELLLTKLRDVERAGGIHHRLAGSAANEFQALVARITELEAGLAEARQERKSFDDTVGEMLEGLCDHLIPKLGYTNEDWPGVDIAVTRLLERAEAAEARLAAQPDALTGSGAGDGALREALGRIAKSRHGAGLDWPDDELRAYWSRLALEYRSIAREALASHPPTTGATSPLEAPEG